MKTRNLSVGQYMGGKFFYRNWILQYLPKKKFRCFNEIFGGMAHVLFGLPERLCTVEVYNDKWDDLVNMFEQLRDNSKAFSKEMKLYPYSRTIFNKFAKKFKTRDFKDDLERAVVILYLNKTSFNGKFGEYFRTSNIRDTAVTLKNKVSQIEDITDRLRDIVIENMDFRDIIKKYDGCDTVFYCDPPYIDTEFYYTPEFTEDDHRDLAEMLNDIKGYAMVSYYEVPILDELYPTDTWDRQYKEGVKGSQYYYGDDKKKLRNSKKDRSMELLLLNYKSKRDFNKINLDKLL